jgi:hypothetical protein
MHTVLQNGVPVGTIASDVYCATRGVAPTTAVAPPVVGQDGTAALELPQAPEIDRHLGKTFGGVALPTAAALVTVARARDNALLPAGVRDVLDDKYVEAVYADQTLDDTAKAALVTNELQNGSRVSNALSRKQTRAGQAAIDAALGLGTKGG